MEAILKYDTEKYPVLKWGFNDLNKDGVCDTLLTVWNSKKMVFVSDDGKLPWTADEEKRDWNEYFNKAFNVGEEPPAIWNEMRSTWGSYTILVDRDDCGRFDSLGDFYYKVLDINGDGKPEAEYYHLFPGHAPYSNKLHINLNGERDMSYLDFKNFFYPDEQRYLEGGKYIMNVHGNGFFLNSYSNEVQNAWENPIAWYDFDFDGRTNMVMRAADTNQKGHLYRGDISEFEVAFELNSNTCRQKYHSLDLQLTFYKYMDPMMDYRKFIDEISGLKGLNEARFLSEKLSKIRHETVRRYIPYLDGYRICMEYDKWDGIWLLFDEDDDDNRWEEMFSRHETEKNSSGNWYKYSDRIGDRIEMDKNFLGKGKIYVGKFDGRIHLYHAEESFWDIDYLALYKGCIDRVNTKEGPEPPEGLRYPRVRYYDKNNNGFIDTIEYMTVEYGDEENTERIEKTVSLLEYTDEENPSSDICELIDPRIDVPLCGWKVSTWDGNPLMREDFEGTSCKAGFDKIYALYTKVCNDMWHNASRLYEIAKRFDLNINEGLDMGLKEDYTKTELGELKEISIPKGYSRHLDGNSRREKYNNGYWLKEKVFADIVQYSGLDEFTLKKYYYTGKIDKLCDYIEKEYTHN